MTYKTSLKNIILNGSYTRQGNCSTHCATTAVNVHTSRQHRTSHSSRITIVQNNCVPALYRLPVVPLTLCYFTFFFFQKFAYISFEIDSNIAENSVFLVRAWLAVKAVKHTEVFFVYGCINVRIIFGNSYWTNLLSILYSGC